MDEVWRARLEALFAGQDLAVLSILEDRHPIGSLVAFAAADELRAIVFATLRDTRKFAGLQAEPRVSLLVDNRSNDPADFRDAMAVTAIGAAREAGANDHDRLRAIYLARHPDMAGFVDRPDCALVRVEVRTYRAVRGILEVTELNPSH